MNNSKLDSIENGLIELLNIKYNIDTYSEKHSFKHRKIEEKTLKENISYDYYFNTFVINKYLQFNNLSNNLSNYDIDIVNLIIKYISIHKTYKSKSIPKNTFLNNIYYYLGYKIQNYQYIKKPLTYFSNKYKNLNPLIQDIYLYIFHDIILLF